MSRLEALQPNASIRGILPDCLVTVVSVQWFGSEALELTYKNPTGRVANELLYRHDEARLDVVEQGRPWSFDGDGHLFRLVSEAHRIRLAHLFDPVLAVHTSLVDPLPHQITAVYEAMLPRQPLRFLRADDPGAGKTIMAGLLIKELIVRGDLQRCLVVCPGSLAEQWQDELYRRFQLPFDILTNDKLEAARTGNWFLDTRVSTLLGRKDAVVLIHGGMSREERLKAQESFRHDPEVQVLLATDAAGEGINLQRAHLMVNYDLPWNPNRLEQRFGRIHRIGQTEVCHLWNLVAEETREGDVYRTLLDKLEQAREALGGQVFDVLGKLQFEGRPLRDLLLEAIRYGERPEVRAKLTEAIASAVDRPQLQALLEERALAQDAMDASRVARVREEMERAEARRLQPHYIESFFLEAFQQLGGTTRQREPRRYEATHVPAPIRHRDRLIGVGEPVLARYERIAFEKTLIAPQGQPLAAFVCPGHPLLDATLDLTLERHRDLLAIVEFLPGDAHHVHYVRCPFQREPDFGVTSVNYDFAELLARAERPV